LFSEGIFEEDEGMFGKNTEGSNSKSDNRGFSLIEIMIALAIFSIGILGVASMQILSVNYNSHARRTSEATTWGVERMESLMTLPYADADLDCVNNNPHTDTRGIYNIAWNVTDNTDNKRINMTVSWTVKGATRNILLNYVKPQDI
jgi:prepilin-type N-terminal cleavage/methylation domain-containing protein